MIISAPDKQIRRISGFLIHSGREMNPPFGEIEKPADKFM